MSSLRILISAAETSSDIHGAELLKAIRERIPAVEAFGIGGPKLQAVGLHAVVDARELLVMGFFEILKHVPTFFRTLNRITKAAEKSPPDLAVVMDYPDFHFLLARRLKKMGIPMVYYIPPKVWAWRQNRVKLLQKYFLKILCILPFEESFYKNLNIPVKYVGNPLVDELPLDLSKADARKKLHLKDTDRVLVLMPGSRASELKMHLELMLEAAFSAATRLRAKRYLKNDEPLTVLMPFPATGNFDVLRNRAEVYVKRRQALKGQKGRNSQLLDLRISQDNAADCLVAADAGLVKSGTSTLEAALLKCPHAVVYKPGRTGTWIFKNLIRYRGPVGLVNLVAERSTHEDYLAREILCENATLETLTEEIVSLMTDPLRREKILNGFEILREKICGRDGMLKPSVCAAEEIIQLYQDLRKRVTECERF